MILHIFIPLLCLISYSECMVGKKCTTSNDCTKNKFLEQTMSCTDNVCQCKEGVEMRLTGPSLTPICDDYELANKLSQPSQKCNITSSTSCGENEECLEYQFKESTFYRDSYLKYALCYCKEGHQRVEHTCKNTTQQDLMERCYKSDVKVYTCDTNKKSFCSEGKCICFDTYFFNTTSKTCEPMTDFVKENNLTKYEVKPNEYCTNDTHCVSGLNCKDFKCACPLPCFYNATAESCDCGKFTRTSPTGSIILGIILGLFVIGFWIWMIKRTVEKFKKKNEENFDNIEMSGGNVLNEGSYTLTPLSPSGTTGGQADLAVSDHENQHLVKGDAPPPYTATSSASDNPPAPLGFSVSADGGQSRP